jgi:drug/metabolite transporter (DMT)-like permease
MSRASSLRHRADLALIAVCLVWGSTFILVKNALEQVSTMLFLAVRFSMAAIALAIIFRGRGAHSHLSRSAELRTGAFVGFWLFTGYVLQTAGLRYTTAAKAGFITGFYIPLVPLLSAAVYRRAPHVSEWIGVALATAGTMLMTLETFSLEIGRGDLLVLGGAFAFAFHILFLGHYSKHIAFERLTVYQIATGALIGLCSFWWIETPRWALTGGVIFALLLTSMLATAFAFTIQTWAQQFTTPTRTALIFSTEPVFAALTSFVVAGEVLGPRAMAGAGLILAGILSVELKPVGRDRP